MENYQWVKSLGKWEVLEVEDLEQELREQGFRFFRKTIKSRLRLKRDPKSSRQVIQKCQQVSLSETEEKHQKAVETITKLEEEKSDLTDQVKTLRDTVENMGNQLCETLLQCEKEQEAHRLLKSEHQEMMETLTNSEKLKKEWKREQEAHRLLKSQYQEWIVKDYEEEQDTHSHLKSEYNEMTDQQWKVTTAFFQQPTIKKKKRLLVPVNIWDSPSSSDLESD
ncbi:hypothetical protein KOW79_008748 [Hemibagrus wyckioides]|uniref:Uncharacterized protein n=1 Tax=Hemibagrus wyckioides TaxID=337641 RepID=A0A9D3SK94_9TELE|nr:hypothetical protein KOW79_008748 [Hemibagrus wyckioides]